MEPYGRTLTGTGEADTLTRRIGQLPVRDAVDQQGDPGHRLSVLALVVGALALAWLMFPFPL